MTLENVIENLESRNFCKIAINSVEDFINYIKPLSITYMHKPVLYVCNINENEISNHLQIIY